MRTGAFEGLMQKMLGVLDAAAHGQLHEMSDAVREQLRTLPAHRLVHILGDQLSENLQTMNTILAGLSQRCRVCDDQPCAHCVADGLRVQELMQAGKRFSILRRCWELLNGGDLLDALADGAQGRPHTLLRQFVAWDSALNGMTDPDALNEHDKLFRNLMDEARLLVDDASVPAPTTEERTDG